MVKLIRRENVQSNIHFFCENSSIHGLHFLTMKNISSLERLVWALVNIATLFTMIFFIIHLWEDYLEEPTIVTLESSHYPIEKVNFPGISICNLNKISKQRAEQFQKSMNGSVSLKDIKILGNLYNFDTYGNERAAHFQEILNKKEPDFDPTIRLAQLASSCHDILYMCMWGGKNYPCEELFLTRMTFEGQCCVFNYIRPSQRKTLWNNTREVPKKSEVSQGAGMEYGLQVILNNQLDDYFYTSRDVVGFNLHIFNSEDFPDVLSGSLTEVILDAGTSVLISLDVDVIESTPQVKTLPVKLRKCKFNNDDTTIFGAYRQSDCFVDCKMKSILALCDCVPFTLPVNTDPSNEARICTLSDMLCLNKHKVKWSRYYPYGTDTTSLEQEQYDSLRCPDCLPNCNSINYNSYTTYAPSFSKSRENVTVINIFMNTAFANLYKIDLTYTWFEILSSFGGVVSLMMGLSLISVVEIFIFLCRITYCIIYKFVKH